MFAYYFGTALRSLRTKLALTILMVFVFGAGIGILNAMLSIFRAINADPIPEKSSRLFTPQIDSYGPVMSRSVAKSLPQDRLPRALTYLDASSIVRAKIGRRQAAMYLTSLSVSLPEKSEVPSQLLGRATSRDFFAMFDVPVEYGTAWSDKDDADGSPVAILSHKLNAKLFGGTNSVGRVIQVNGDVYRVAGVLKEWNPIPRFYDLGGGGTLAFAEPEQIFLPLENAIRREFPSAGGGQCLKNPGADMRAFIHSECTWMRVWVELPDPVAVGNFRSFLVAYADQQRQLGRFNWPTHIALRGVREWISYNDVVPTDIDILMFVAFAFLAVCIVNASGLLLATFMARGAQISIRRALGASAVGISVQCLIEAAVVGLVSSALGIGLSVLGLTIAKELFVIPVGDAVASITQLKISDIWMAGVMSIGAALIAGIYPSWRAMSIEPGALLKA